MAAMPRYEPVGKFIPEADRQENAAANGNQRINMHTRTNAALPANDRKMAVDSDKMLIIIMIAILMKNGADMPIIAALVYILIG